MARDLSPEYQNNPKYRTHIDRVTEGMRRRANKPDRRLSTAYHEAAHAVEAIHLGATVLEASIEWRFGGLQADWDSEGRVSPRWPDHLDYPMQLEASCRVALAGRVGEQLRRGKRARLLRYGGTDLEVITNAASYLNQTGRTRVAWIRWQWLKTLDDLEGLWPCVEAVAKQLLLRERLSAEDLDRIVKLADQANEAGRKAAQAWGLRERRKNPTNNDRRSSEHR